MIQPIWMEFESRFSRSKKCPWPPTFGTPNAIEMTSFYQAFWGITFHYKDRIHAPNTKISSSDDTSLPLYHSYSVSNWSLNIFDHYQFHLFIIEASRPPRPFSSFVSSNRSNWNEESHLPDSCLWGCRKSSCGHMLCRESRSHFKPRWLLFLPVILKWKTAIYLKGSQLLLEAPVFHFYIASTIMRERVLGWSPECT